MPDGLGDPAQDPAQKERLLAPDGGEWVLEPDTRVGAGGEGYGRESGPGPYEGNDYDGDRPDSMRAAKFVESAPGRPRVVGCADGQRELFADVKRFGSIAGCLGEWSGAPSLRDSASGVACGDDGTTCSVPADVCASGWHVCGTNDSADDLSSHVTGKECANAGPGRFNAALSHSSNDDISPCATITPKTKLPCVQAGVNSEAVCCGNDCEFGVCKNGVWLGKTKISRGTSEGCGAVTSRSNGGMLCCSDPAVKN